MKFESLNKNLSYCFLFFLTAVAGIHGAMHFFGEYQEEFSWLKVTDIIHATGIECDVSFNNVVSIGSGVCIVAVPDCFFSFKNYVDIDSLVMDFQSGGFKMLGGAFKDYKIILTFWRQKERKVF